jgi:hypothetical protein
MRNNILMYSKCTYIHGVYFGYISLSMFIWFFMLYFTVVMWSLMVEDDAPYNIGCESILICFVKKTNWHILLKKDRFIIFLRNNILMYSKGTYLHSVYSGYISLSMVIWFSFYVVYVDWSTKFSTRFHAILSFSFRLQVAYLFILARNRGIVPSISHCS